ncbi:MAG: hypothetical protein IPQ13_11690 [Holophagaceae bacterium]|nr:hypothetical protein [Holophagaceae bacterium]
MRLARLRQPMRRLALAFTLCPLFAQAPGALPRGELVPRVVCASDARFSYALYLPSGYREDRAWPVLYGFSPGGSGEEPVRLFQKTAERFGWIVVGSNESRNGPLRPSLEASEAMWKDVRSRFKVDPKRSYSAGFSGGARMAMRLALKHPKNFAGLVSIGAFGTGDGMLTGLGHLRFHLSCGLEDFNHWELQKGRQELQSRGWKALADRFEGGHRWATEAAAASALGYLQLGAGRDGLTPKDPALESEVCRELELNAVKAGRTLLALRRWRELAALCPDSREGRSAREHIAELEKESTVAEELKLEKRYETAAAELPETPKGTQYQEVLVRHLDRLKTSPPTEQLMIRRLLGGPILSYQLALGEAFQERSWERLLALSTSLAALDDREGWPCVYAAISLAQLGRPGEAIPHLKMAQVRGYRKPERLRGFDELKPLAGREDFEAILKDMEPERPR